MNVKGPILFITGAGASVDSGLRTYRGPGGVYEEEGNPAQDLSIDTWRSNPTKTWNTLSPLVKAVRKAKPGPTYQLMKEIAKKYDVTIHTQNVDGFSRTVCDEVWEMHGDVRTMFCEHCRGVYELDEHNYICGKCREYCKPNIVFYGEDIRPRTTLRKRFKTVIVIGTTLQFPYLRNMINQYRQKGAVVIHINPADNYSSFVGYDTWMKMKSEDALKQLFVS